MELKERITSKFSKTAFLPENNDWSCVDKYIRKFVKRLNSYSNIATKFCCEGHMTNDQAYLYFVVNENGWDAFWQKVLPDLCCAFSSTNTTVHPSMVFQFLWVVNVVDQNNKDGGGITIHAILDDSESDVFGVGVSWKEKKEYFWKSMIQVFDKHMAS